MECEKKKYEEEKEEKEEGRRMGKKKVLKNKMSQKISVLEDVEKLEHLCIIRENIKDAAVVENSMEIPQKIKHRITL